MSEFTKRYEEFLRDKDCRSCPIEHNCISDCIEDEKKLTVDKKLLCTGSDNPLIS